jgi:hypothetical protein
VGSRVRRITDKAKFLRAGADVFLDFPLDVPLLKVSVDNLLRRVGRLNGPLRPESEAPQFQRRPNVTCTMDLDYFCERAAEEYARPELVSGSPMLTLRMSSGKPLLEELSSTALLTARAADLVYVGSRGVAVLLVDSTRTDSFLSRFSQSWAAEASPRVEQPHISGHGNLLKQLRQFVHEETGLSFPQQGGNTLNGKSFEAVVAGHRVENPE